MRFNKILILLAFAAMMVSCKPTKNIAYFTDLSANDVAAIASVQAQPITIRPDDKLQILVNSSDPRISNLFNLPMVLQQVGADNTNPQGMALYTVNSKGDIDFPELGTLHVAGLTRSQVAELIKKDLIDRGYVKDAVVTVEFRNLKISVLGEVNNPGRYNVVKDNYTLLDALGDAGDLTIYGRRDNVLVMRNENGQQHVYKINMQSAKDLYSSPAYYLRQDDVIYVEPNDTRARQSTVNGNNIRSTSFWISLASLLTSVSLLFVR